MKRTANPGAITRAVYGTRPPAFVSPKYRPIPFGGLSIDTLDTLRAIRRDLELACR